MTEREFNELKTKYGLTCNGYGKLFNLVYCNRAIAVVVINKETEYPNEKIGINFDGKMRILNPIAADNKIKKSIIELKQLIIQKKLEDIEKDFK